MRTLLTIPVGSADVASTSTAKSEVAAAFAEGGACLWWGLGWGKVGSKV